MKTNPNPSAAAALRQRAEARLQERTPEPGPGWSEADTLRLVHELQVHQIELELQNEELQRAHGELEAGLERYTDLYDFAPVGYLTLDDEGTIREANLAAATLLGIERSRLVKRRLGLSIAPTDRAELATFLTRVFETKAKAICEVTLLREGKPLVEVRMEAAMAPAGQECRVVLEDITEQRRAEADRLILNKLESTGILAGGIAHDFNNLLTVILLHIELAEQHAAPNQELAQHLALAKKPIGMARSLTQQLITFSAGNVPIRQATGLAKVIEDSVRPALSGSPLRCDFSLPVHLWPAEVDAGQIAQVIRNLVINAREAMPEGGLINVGAENVVLGPRKHPSLPPGDYVQVSLADRGVGIPKDMLPSIFDPYFSTKQRGAQTGMGLGLAICHSIMQKHGGAITVESVVGAGTTFHLYLPAVRKMPSQPPRPVAAAGPRQGRILVMDDEEFMRVVVGKALAQLGQQVELVADGEQALAAYAHAQSQGCPFDAVLLDLTIRAGMGGRETMQRLIQLDPAAKGIVMSGYSDDPVLREPERYGFQAALAKPFDITKLAETLAQVITS
jgi:PAS domain S-box-containing protein